MSLSITRHDRGHLLETEVRLPHPRARVFGFFADAANLEAITPPSLRFRILTPMPIEMRPGAVIDYRLRIRGLPVRWRSLISAWEPPRRFVDEQVRGPYRWWRHEHLFEADEEATVVRDRVSYGVPGGRPVHALLVAGPLRAIFRYRRRTLLRLFAPPATHAGPA